MSFTLALAQVAHPEDNDYAAQAARMAARAHEAHADILVFPEALMTPWQKTAQEFMQTAEPLDGTFGKTMAELARTHGLWIVYTANEQNAEGGRSFNTAVVMSPDGDIKGSYRKTHLFDADVTRESDRISAGDALFAPLNTGFATLGLAICYDIRFPEIARAQALQGADVLLYPAAWYDGPSKLGQWHTLIKARAIENECYVAGLSRCGGKYAGCSLIAAPDGTVVAQAGPDEELLVADIDLQAIDKMRASIPVFQHRRPELY